MSRSNQGRNKYLTLRGLSNFYDFKFDQIREYLNHTQELITSLEQDLSVKVNKWDRENQPPDIPDGYSIYEYEVITTVEFRPLLNRSMYLTVYSLFENKFVILCEFAAGIQGSKLRPKDLSGNNYIDQCRRFVTKVLNVNLEKLQSEWRYPNN